MLKFNLNLKGLEKGENLTKQKTKTILMKCMFKMEELAVNNAPVHQGFLKQNINLFPQVLNDKYELKSNALYSEAVEYGTRPFYAPIQPLKDWARLKLGDESIGYAVQKKIAREGIKASPFMRPAYYDVLFFWKDYFIKQELNQL